MEEVELLILTDDTQSRLLRNPVTGDWVVEVEVEGDWTEISHDDYMTAVLDKIEYMKTVTEGPWQNAR